MGEQLDQLQDAVWDIGAKLSWGTLRPRKHNQTDRVFIHVEGLPGHPEAVEKRGPDLDSAAFRLMASEWPSEEDQAGA